MGGERPLWAEKLDGKDGVGEKMDEGVASWDLGVVCCWVDVFKDSKN